MVFLDTAGQGYLVSMFVNFSRYLCNTKNRCASYQHTLVSVVHNLLFIVLYSLVIHSLTRFSFLSHCYNDKLLPRLETLLGHCNQRLQIISLWDDSSSRFKWTFPIIDTSIIEVRNFYKIYIYSTVLNMNTIELLYNRNIAQPITQ